MNSKEQDQLYEDILEASIAFEWSRATTAKELVEFIMHLDIDVLKRLVEYAEVRNEQGRHR